MVTAMQPADSARPTEEKSVVNNVADADGQTPIPPKRKASKNPVAEKEKDDAGEKNGNQKRRRRVFSCQSCQRLKCRCEYDPGSQACHRCVTLRFAPPDNENLPNWESGSLNVHIEINELIMPADATSLVVG
jgi:hypothetical protein